MAGRSAHPSARGLSKRELRSSSKDLDLITGVENTLEGYKTLVSSAGTLHARSLGKMNIIHERALRVHDRENFGTPQDTSSGIHQLEKSEDSARNAPWFEIQGS